MASILDVLRVCLLWVVAVAERPHALEPIERDARWPRITEQRAAEAHTDKKTSLVQQLGRNGSTEKPPRIHIHLGGGGSQQMVSQGSEDYDGESGSEGFDGEQNGSGSHVVHIIPASQQNTSGSRIHVLHILLPSHQQNGSHMHVVHIMPGGHGESNESSAAEEERSEGGAHTDPYGSNESSSATEGESSESWGTDGSLAHLLQALGAAHHSTGRHLVERHSDESSNSEGEGSSSHEGSSSESSWSTIPGNDIPAGEMQGHYPGNDGGEMQGLFLHHLMEALHSPHHYPGVNVYTPTSSQAQCNILDEQRRDCGYYGITPHECLAKGCCWLEADEEKFLPWCVYGPQDLLLQELLKEVLAPGAEPSMPASHNMFGLMGALPGMNATMPPGAGHSRAPPHVSITVHLKNIGNKAVGQDTVQKKDSGHDTKYSEFQEGWHMGNFERSYKGQEHLDPPWIPKGGSARSCSFIADCGSTGNRLQIYTTDNMCPDDQYIPLDCGRGEQYPLLYLFAASRGIDSKKKQLTMRQIVSLQAGIGLEPSETWIDDYPRLRQPGYLTDCVAHTLLLAVMNMREFCSSASIDLDATAGVRNYEAKLQQEGKQDEVARYQKAIKYLDTRLKQVFAPYRSNGIKFNSFTVLRIKDEAELEAASVRLWSSSIMSASGGTLTSAIAGIFSMGGKSSQFVRFKDHSNVQDGIFLLGYGHKQGLQDYNAGTTNRFVTISEDDRRKQVVAGVAKAFAVAKELGRMQISDDFGTGLWIGVTNTVLAAESAFGLQLKTETVYTLQDVRSHMEQALATIDPGEPEQRKILIKLIIINYWLGQVFEDGATFYFRHKWPLPKGGGCVYSEWPSAEAVLNDEDLQQDLGFKPSNISFARVLHSEVS